MQFRDSPGSILCETSSAPARASHTVFADKTLLLTTTAFTNESGMVKMPCGHSLIHFHHLVPRGMLTDIHFPLNLPAALKREPVSGKMDITIGTATAELL